MTALPGPVYAVGDIHGRDDLLEAMLAAIEADAGASPRVIFLGDVIDRGPDSRRALDLVAETLARWPDSQLILGNHEDFLLRFVCRPESRDRTFRNWLYNGAAETFRSYGIDPALPTDRAAALFEQRFGAHIDMLRNAEYLIEHGAFIFVHAGIDPAVGLDHQDPNTTRWIRDEFLLFDGPLPKTIVHGHTQTVSDRPEVHANRIGIDTGAYRTGRLTCAVVRAEARDVRFLATREADGDIVVEDIQPVAQF